MTDTVDNNLDGAGAADVAVLGAGIVGLSVALHLQARGRDVWLIDRDAPGQGTSFGNAGVIERASVVPYAFPRNAATILRHALNRGSDVRYAPACLPRVLPWLVRYWWHSAPDRLAVAARDMLPLIQRSVEEHLRLADAAGSDAQALIRSVGLLHVFRDRLAFDAAVRLAEPQAAQHRLDLAVLDRPALQALEPALAGALAGALHWQAPHAVTDPAALSAEYAALFVRRGGRILRAEVSSLQPRQSQWVIHSRAADTLRARAAVVALGPWSSALLRPLGYRLPVAIKRGYHMHYAVDGDAVLGRPMIDERAGFAMAPMARGIRLTTGVELAAAEAPLNVRQLDLAERVARQLLPSLGERLDPAPWLGRRPCLPDMRPVIGAAPRHPGLWLAFGHAHHGLTLGPATGRLLAELMSGETPFADPQPFSAARFLRASQRSVA